MTVYEWRISDWVSDVFSSDLAARRRHPPHHALRHRPVQVHLLRVLRGIVPGGLDRRNPRARVPLREPRREHRQQAAAAGNRGPARNRDRRTPRRRSRLPLRTAWITNCSLSLPSPWCTWHTGSEARWVGTGGVVRGK